MIAFAFAVSIALVVAFAAPANAQTSECWKAQFSQSTTCYQSSSEASTAQCNSAKGTTFNCPSPGEVSASQFNPMPVTTNPTCSSGWYSVGVRISDSARQNMGSVFCSACTPGASVSGGGTCPCPFGQSLQNGVCAPTPCTGVEVRDTTTGLCRCPNSVGEWPDTDVNAAQASGLPASSRCIEGCSASVFWGLCVTKTGGVRTCFGSITGAPGTTCTPSTAETTPAEDQPILDCMASGRTWGTVNGVGTCLPVGTPGTPTTATGPSATTSTTNPDGSTSTVESRTTRNCASDGTCTDTTTTTTTTRNSSGAVTGTTTSTNTTIQPPGTRGFPGATGSGGGDSPATPEDDPSTFGGACGGGFSCSGDAIQCAIASEQHRRNCETLGARSNATQAATDAAVNDAVAGTGTGENFLPRTTVDMSSINTGERINAGSCPAPVAVSTPLGSFSVDITNLCAPLSWFGLIILAASLLVAGRITFGGL